MCGNVAASGAAPVFCLAAMRATYRPTLDATFIWAKNGPSQLRRSVGIEDKETNAEVQTETKKER